MSRRTIAVAALALLGGTVLAGAQLSEDYRFKGEVVDQQGKSIPQVSVVLHDAKTGTRINFVTGKDGAFDRRMIPHGVYDATFSKEGYVPYTDRFDWSATSNQTIVKVARIVLENEAEKARVELGKKEAKLYEDAYADLAASKFEDAREKANQLLELGAGNYEYAVRFIIARADAMLGEVEPAVTEYGKVLALKPDLFEAHFDLAGLYEKQGKVDDAVREYQKAAEINPADAETQYDLGVIYMKEKKDYAQAKVHLAKAVEIDPTHSQATKALGLVDLWSPTPDVAEGVRLLKRYLELEPKAADSTQIREMIRSFQ